MNILLFLLGLGVFAMLLVWAIRTPSRWQQLVQTAAQDGDIAPMMEELSRRPKELQPRFYDEAMHVLVHDNLDVATRFMIAFTPTHTDQKRVQFWLAELQNLEPKSPLLTTEFLEQHHRASCSPAGG